MSFETLAKAFVSPLIANTLSSTESIISDKVFPQESYDVPYDEPYQYLPPPGPVFLSPTWKETFWTIGSFSSITALYMGIGAMLGVTAVCCRREKGADSDDEDVDEVSSEDPEWDIKREMIGVAGQCEGEKEVSDVMSEDSEMLIKQEVINLV